MVRLIDADALKKGIKELKQSPWYNNDINPSWRQGIKDAVHVVEMLCIEEAPTVEAVPVVHGHWQNIGDLRDAQCSVCGKWLDVLQGSADMNYCPNCGSKMDEV